MVKKNDRIEYFDSYSNTSAFVKGGDKKKYFFTIIFTLYLALTLVRYLTPGNFLLTGAVVFLGLLSLILLSVKIPKDNIYIYIFTGLLAIAFFFSSIFVLRVDRVGHVLLFIFLNFGIALILLRRHVYSQGAYLVFYALAFYMALLILTGIDPNEALKVVSRNGISEMMIVACVSLYIIQKNEAKEIDLKPAFFTFLISIWGVGRSGFISSFILLAGLFLIRMHHRKSYIFAIFFVLLSTFFIIDQLVLLGTDYPFFSRAIDYYFVQKNQDGPNPRIAMWTNYFNNLDTFRVIFGANVRTDPWPDGERYAYNYHNMFIQLHLQTGLMAIVFYVLILFALIQFWRTNKVFFVLLLTICLRGMTDTFLLFESWDFILYFFIYYFLRNLYLSIKVDQRRSETGSKLRSWYKFDNKTH